MDQLAPLAQEIGVTAALGLLGLAWLYRAERAERQAAQKAERETWQMTTEAIRDLTDAIKRGGGDA